MLNWELKAIPINFGDLQNLSGNYGFILGRLSKFLGRAYLQGNLSTWEDVGEDAEENPGISVKLSENAISDGGTCRFC